MNVNNLTPAQLDAKRYRDVLEWIEYDRFEDVKYLTKGGFGTTYKAIWKDGDICSWDSTENKWKRGIFNEDHTIKVALKSMHNLQDITTEFLREFDSHVVTSGKNGGMIRCYGITKNPKTKNFMMVMSFVEIGGLRYHLDKIFNLLDWKQKLTILKDIANGLNENHDDDTLLYNIHNAYITDLGLCQLANIALHIDNKEINEVLPYVAPEVLKGEKYTQESSIYGFGVIAYEVCTGLPPYHNMGHDEFLSIEICKGLRPTSDYKIPRLIFELIEKCWDTDPLKRPKIAELRKVLGDLCNYNLEISKQFEEVDKFNDKITCLTSPGMILYSKNSQAIYTSRFLDFDNLPEPKNADDD
ncbi:kinase-like domain-containing protein [Rhizophagus clarus]|uniref:Kinase-like domain-containing protein n=1 Tax=Rhizophagus clarus TaxID=94130 RepID=A0A8H3QU94_9GLOM|nr:kinase-like domain-containing protein [Rhizophagus clarus]